VVFDPLYFSPTAAETEEGPPNLRDPCYFWEAGKVADGYSCKKTARQGDLYLFWFADPYSGVCGIGVCDGNVRRKDETNWPFWPRWGDGYVCGYDPFLWLEQPVLLNDITADSILAEWWQGMPARGGAKTMVTDRKPFAARRMVELIRGRNPELAPTLDEYIRGLPEPSAVMQPSEEVTTQEEQLIEGAVCRVVVNAYERNPVARAHCIAHYGTACVVCGFNFGAVYGPLAQGFIQVHHLKPLSEIGEKYEVDPVADLRPVCPNCHAVIHLGGGCRSIEEARCLVDPRVLAFWASFGKPVARAGRPRE
jgi:hypothetical protein